MAAECDDQRKGIIRRAAPKLRGAVVLTCLKPENCWPRRDRVLRYFKANEPSRETSNSVVTLHRGSLRFFRWKLHRVWNDRYTSVRRSSIFSWAHNENFYAIQFPRGTPAAHREGKREICCRKYYRYARRGRKKIVENRAIAIFMEIHTCRRAMQLYSNDRPPYHQRTCAIVSRETCNVTLARLTQNLTLYIQRNTIAYAGA